MSAGDRAQWLVHLACGVGAVASSACGRIDFDGLGAPIAGDAGVVADACPDAGCSLTTTVTVGCGDGALTGDQLCQQRGYSGAAVANGYYWYQCAGYVEHVCPGGFDADLRCTTWCGNVDCVGVPYCGGGEQIQEVLSDGAVVFDPEAYGLTCGPFNPGWLVRLRCET